jgi:ABC-type dipeptide/oligopeptide/nickel transport system permease component
VLALGAGVLALVLAHPAVDEAWENHPAHFWLVLVAAAINVALGYAVGAAARRRRDARLLLVSLAFVSAAGFLGLHALATPGVLIGKNAGFELATPVGLAFAGLFAGNERRGRPPDRRRRGDGDLQPGRRPARPRRAARTALLFQSAATDIADDHLEWPRFR